MSPLQTYVWLGDRWKSYTGDSSAPVEPDPGEALFQPTNFNVGLPGVGNPAMESTLSGTTFNTDNAVYERVEFTSTSPITFSGDNVTVRECKFNGDVSVRQLDGALFEDCDVPAITFRCENFTARRLRITGLAGSDGINVTSDVTQARGGLIEYCYIGNGKLTAQSHYDGTQVRGVQDLTIQFNNYDILADVGAQFDSRHNASIFLEDANGGNSDVTVHHNWSRVNGYYHFRPYGSNIVITNNIFIPLGGDPEPTTPFIGNGFGYTGSGNKWLDGTPVPV